MFESASAPKTAVIAGVTGAVGAALALELSKRSDWRVLGIARNLPAAPIAGVEYLHVDMSDTGQLEAALEDATNITHLFYCARVTHAEQVIEDAGENLALIRNILDAVLAAASNFQHAHVVQGGKYYGVHVGPFKTPAKEEDSRAPIDNFNYDQQDFLVSASKNEPWSWSASRPNTLLHFSPNIARNLVSTLGAYASLCKSLGAALDFPGPPGAYRSLTQVTTLPLLARAIAWMSTSPECANQAFNVTNTDLFRWEQLWPRLADAFDMPLGIVRPMQLAQTLATREQTWNKICVAHQLPERALNAVANWGYADATLERYWDEILSHTKCRQYGFDDWDDSIETFFQLLAMYREAEILPPR